MSRAIHALGWTRKKGKKPAETRAIKEELLSAPKLFKQALEQNGWGLLGPRAPIAPQHDPGLQPPAYRS